MPRSSLSRHIEAETVHAGDSWDRTGFNAFMAARDSAQEAQDQKRLRRIFAAAASPVAREAFAWAEDNDVKFFIDRRVEKAAAYYTIGTGVVGVGAAYVDNPVTAIAYLVHEIRHAWQDRQGMIPTQARSFAEFFTQIALVEADASAWQKTAEREESVALWQEEGMKPLPSPPREDVLAIKFTAWHQAHGKFYGDVAARNLAHKLGIAGIRPVDFKCEFKPAGQAAPAIRGIPLTLETVTEQLGRGFVPANDDRRGGARTPNYLAQPAARAYLENRLLVPRLAQRFFQSAGKLPPLVKDINAAMSQKQRAHRRKHGTDFYL